MELRTLVAVALTLSILAFPAPVAADPSEVTIAEASHTGAGVVGAQGDAVRLWRSEPHAVDVTLSDSMWVRNSSTRVKVCVGVAGDTSRRLNCRTATVDDDETTVAVPVEEWPPDVTGDRTVAVTVWDARSDFEESALHDRHTVPVAVLEKDGDLDSDRLSNVREVDLGTNLTAADTDGDGLRDGEEVEEYETDPTGVDTDIDGLRDGEEINRGTDPTAADTDGDGLSDRAEIDEYGTNPREADTDGDGLSDSEEIRDHETDPTETDTDGDGLTDRAEVNRYGTDPREADTDGDGLTDVEEAEEHGTDPTAPDTDGDFVRDGTEIAVRSAPNSPVSPLADAVALLGGAVAAARRVGGPGELAPVDRLETLGAAVRAGPDESAETGPSDESSSGADPDRGSTEPADADGAAKPTLIADETRVLRMLDEHDGRLPQSEVVERTEWSKSKVSRLLSRMEDDGQIRKITIGRENLVTRPSDEPLETGRGRSDD